jgi:hypothetical protein
LATFATHRRCTLTNKGRAALADWMEQPARFPRIQHEAIVRLVAADIVGEEAVLDSLKALRDEIAAISERLDAAEAVAIPSRGSTTSSGTWDRGLAGDQTPLASTAALVFPDTRGLSVMPDERRART